MLSRLWHCQYLLPSFHQVLNIKLILKKISFYFFIWVSNILWLVLGVEDDKKKDEFGFPKFVVMGHRGFGMNILQSPDEKMKSIKENSILSFNVAADFPIDFVEFDVQVWFFTYQERNHNHIDDTVSIIWFYFMFAFAFACKVQLWNWNHKF